MCAASTYHTPVLGPETAEWVINDPRGTYVDGTVGGGGHAEYLLSKLGAGGKLIGIDRDPHAIEEASRRLSPYGNRARIVQGLFWNLRDILSSLEIFRISGIVLDLGVSSRQIDDPGRGFSFQQDGPLDMRMGPDAPRSAADILNTCPRDALVRIFKTYGEERAAGRIARAICRRRAHRPFLRTLDLAGVVAGEARGPHAQKTLARIFQALRIEVNDELGRLSDALNTAQDALHPGGRIAVLSYHSLEDRTVKQAFRNAARGCICPPDLPVCGCGRVATQRVLARIRPDKAEQARNPRSRSATLRVAERLGNVEK